MTRIAPLTRRPFLSSNYCLGENTKVEERKCCCFFVHSVGFLGGGGRGERSG